MSKTSDLLPQNVHELPSHLKVLRALKIHQLTNDTVAKLPRTLTHLEIQEIQKVPQSNVEAPMIMLATCDWPPMLSVLSVESGLPDFSNDAVENLPKWLNKIEKTGKIGTTLIGRLPRGLVSLHIGDLTVDVPEDPIDWPPRLTELKIDYGSLQPHHLSELPKSLKTLFTPMEYFVDPIDYERLPVQLKVINVNSNTPNKKDFAAWTGPFDSETRMKKAPPQIVDVASASGSDASTDSAPHKHIHRHGESKKCIIS